MRLIAAIASMATVLLASGCASIATTGASTQDAPPVAAKPTSAPEPHATPVNDAPASVPTVAGTDAPRLTGATGWGPDSNLWDRIRAGFALPELDSRLVAEKERFYLANPQLLQQMFERGGRYLFHIVEELDRRGMPTEIALLPFVESAMNPVAVSPAQAAGLWQFIPSTGKAYDLHQNWWVDNRRDPVKSTRAALDYLQKINEMHGGDWFLALASYNWGENAVARAVRKNQVRGRPTDYLSLDMPAETRHYVPKLIALKNILLKAEQLGIAMPRLLNKPYFVTVEKTRPIDLELAAQFAGMSVEDFVSLNPAHNRPVIAASRNNQIKVPADRRQAFLDAVERHEKARKAFATWQPYTLQSGETLEALAKRSGVSVSELRRANGFRAHQHIVAGTRMLAPQRSIEDETRVESFVAPRIYEQVDQPAVYHTVRGKETIASIAHRYGVSTATLAAWNGLKRGVSRGMRLLVRPAATQTLLTDEEGDRSVVASVPKPGFMKAVLNREDSVEEPAPQKNRKVRARASASGDRKPVVRTSAPNGKRKSDRNRTGT